MMALILTYTLVEQGNGGRVYVMALILTYTLVDILKQIHRVMGDVCV